MTCSRTPSCNARSSRCERPQPLCQVASPAPHARAMSRVQRFIAGLCHVTDDVATVSTISLGTAISAWCKAQSVELSTKKLRGNSTYKSGPPAPSCAPCRTPTAFALNRPQERLVEACTDIGAGRAHPKGGPEARGGRRDEGRGELAGRVHGGGAGRPDQARRGARPRPPPTPPHVIRGCDARTRQEVLISKAAPKPVVAGKAGPPPPGPPPPPMTPAPPPPATAAPSHDTPAECRPRLVHAWRAVVCMPTVD